MNTPIKPRASKPRVRAVGPVIRRRYGKFAGPEQYTQYRSFICYDDNVRAKGKTIEGAYKNWVSLKIDRADKRALNYRAKAADGVSLAAKALFVLSSDRDYK